MRYMGIMKFSKSEIGCLQVFYCLIMTFSFKILHEVRRILDYQNILFVEEATDRMRKLVEGLLYYSFSKLSQKNCFLTAPPLATGNNSYSLNIV